MCSRLAVEFHGCRLEGRDAIPRVQLLQTCQEATGLIEVHRAISRDRQRRWKPWQRVAGVVADDILDELQHSIIGCEERLNMQLSWPEASSSEDCADD